MPLPNNKAVSLRRFSNLQNRRQRLDVTESYGQIIEKQKSVGTVEVASDSLQAKEFYISHKPVICIAGLAQALLAITLIKD